MGKINLQPSEESKPLRPLDKVSVQTCAKIAVAENTLLIIGERLKDVVRCLSSTRGRLYIACLK